MGKIYEKIRQLENEEYSLAEEEIEVSDTFISFEEFINLLMLFSQDNKKTIANYLLSSDSFLKLDHYYNSKPYNLYYSHFTKISYDGITEDDLEYEEGTTEKYLEDFIDNEHEIDSSVYYWKIQDLLDIDEIKNIGLHKENFDFYRQALFVDSLEYINLVNENKQLKMRLDNLHKSSNEFEITCLLENIREYENVISEQKAKITDLEKSITNGNIVGLSKNDEQLHPRTANNASKIISALTSELLKMDLTKPYADETNGKIKEAIEKQGNELGKDKIGFWLKLAHDQSK